MPRPGALFGTLGGGKLYEFVISGLLFGGGAPPGADAASPGGVIKCGVYDDGTAPGTPSRCDAGCSGTAAGHERVASIPGIHGDADGERSCLLVLPPTGAYGFGGAAPSRTQVGRV